MHLSFACTLTSETTVFVLYAGYHPFLCYDCYYIVTQAAASTSLFKDLLLASEEGRLHDVQSLLDGGRCKVNDEDEVCTLGQF